MSDDVILTSPGPRPPEPLRKPMTATLHYRLVKRAIVKAEIARRQRALGQDSLADCTEWGVGAALRLLNADRRAA